MSAESINNIAFGKKCRYSPVPTYSLTKDSNDPFYLTDGGKLYNEDIGRGTFWGRKSSVGWVRANIVEIIIDLESFLSVGTVKINTVGGGRAGVEYPEYVVAMISSDGQDYSLASFNNSDGWDFRIPQNAEVKTISLDIFQKTRFVKLLIRPTGALFFTDEIEVTGIKDEQIINRNNKILDNNEVVHYIERLRQINRNINSLREVLINSRFSLETHLKELNILYELLQRLFIGEDSVDLVEIENRVGKIRANVLNLKYNKQCLYKVVDPIDLLRYEDIPKSIDPNSLPVISIYQGQNEFGSATVNITNCTDKDLIYTLSISPLIHNSNIIRSKDMFEIRRSVYIFSKNTGLFADPLVLQEERPFKVSPGETTQVWIDFSSKDMISGFFNGALSISSNDEKGIEVDQVVIPIKIEITNYDFLQSDKFYSYCWDYITARTVFTNRFPELAVKDMDSHYINVSIVSPDLIYDRVNTDRYLSKSLHNEIKLRKHGDIFLLYMGLKSQSNKEKFGEYKTSEWKTNFIKFLGEIRAFMRFNKLGYESYAIYPFDEYIGDDFLYVANVIREFDPKIRIFANRIDGGSYQLETVAELIDIWCLDIKTCIENTNWINDIPKDLGQIWTYAVINKYNYVQGGNRNSYRLIPIMSSYFGMTGAGFWIYSDWNGGDWLNEDITSYGVVYEGKKCPVNDCILEPIVPSKRWRQWRLGVQDAVALQGHPDILEEFFEKTDNINLTNEITSEYLTSLRRRADQR